MTLVIPWQGRCHTEKTRVDRVQTHRSGQRLAVHEGGVLKNFSTGLNLSGEEMDRSGRGDHGWPDRPDRARTYAASIWQPRSPLHAKGARLIETGRVLALPRLGRGNIDFKMNRRSSCRPQERAGEQRQKGERSHGQPIDCNEPQNSPKPILHASHPFSGVRPRKIQ